MNTYRVDVSDSPRVVPCGMNSIKYIGDSWKSARAIFEKQIAGVDAWNNASCLYGVILSAWNGKEYVVKCSKGFQ